jgi:uncharacterized damage-inducible protein DinB
MSQTLSEFFRHNLWANMRMLDVCEGLSDEELDRKVPGVFSSIRELLVHTVGAEQRYVFRLTGRKPESFVGESEGFPAFEALREAARMSGEALIEVAEGPDVQEDVTVERPDGKWEIARRLYLLQAINHATEHRTHIMTLVSHRGTELSESEAIDGWSYATALGDTLMRRIDA